MRTFLKLPTIALLCCLALNGSLAHADELKVAVAQSGEHFIVDATMDAQVSLETAWKVLTDFDHMTAILSNLTTSKILAKNGNTWLIRQEGVAKYGLLSFAFYSEREIRLEPMQRILAKNLSGTVKRMESEARLSVASQGTHIDYHAEVTPDSILARMFGASFIRHEVEEQFHAMLQEMLQRQSTDIKPQPRGRQTG